MNRGYPLKKKPKVIKIDQVKLLNDRILRLQEIVDENGGEIYAGQAQNILNLSTPIFISVDLALRQRHPDKYARSKGVIREIGQYAETSKRLRKKFTTTDTTQKEPEAGIFLPIFDRKLMTFIFDP